MSPSPGDAPPRTPERKSSSAAILSAFRTLTQGRPKSTSHAAVTPLQSTFSTGDARKERCEARQLSDNGSISTGHTAGTEDSTACATKKAVEVDVVGGTPELNKLLPQLHRARPTRERIAVVQKISPILDQYRVNNALAIWNTGEDLLTHDSHDASRAGHTLLVSCARSGDLSGQDRSVLFASLHALKDDRHTDLRFQALVELTSNGRNVDALETSLAPFLVRLLQANFVVVSESRKNHKKAKSDLTIAEETVFSSLFQYIVEMIKFSSRSFKEEDIALILDQILSICKRTTSQHDIACSITIIDALMTYTTMTWWALMPCLELLCEVFRQLSPLKSPTWAALRNIFRSHLGPASLLHLIDILNNVPTPAAYPNNTNRGAVAVLGHLFRKNGKEGLPEVPLMLILPAICNALAKGDQRIAADVIVLFGSMVESEVMLEKLKEQPNWDAFVNATLTCGQILELSAAPKNSEASKDALSIKQQRGLDLPGASAAFTQMVSTLSTVFPDLDLIHKEYVASLFLQLGSQLSDEAAEVTIKYYADDRLVYPSNPKWLDKALEVLKTYLHDPSRSSRLRVLVADLLQDVYAVVELILSKEQAADYVLFALERMDEEDDPAVLEALSSFAVFVVETATYELFVEILATMRKTIFKQRPTIALSQNLSPSSALPVGSLPQAQPSLCRIASKYIVRMFVRNINKDAKKAETLFAFVLDVAGSNECATDARICAVKLLFRIRATADYAIYVRRLSESESVAAVLCRTAETAKWITATEEAGTKDTRNVSSGNMQSSKQKQFKVKKPVPPLWFYPGPKGLPEEPPREPSPVLVSYVDPAAERDLTDNPTTLKMTHWLEKIIDLLQQPETDWEIYSYVVVHLGAQLANQSLFKGAIPQIKFLRNVLCDQIRSASFHEPPSYTSLKKADVAVCVLHVLTILVSYHFHFARSEEDEIVRAFLLGIGSWDRTSKWCIHALSVCCHEMPLSVSRHLDGVIQKMSQIITKSQIAIHILEFLVMLARLPELYKTFREDEYKTVFGVSFRYLQFVRDQQEKEKAATETPRPARTAMRHSDSFRELRILNDQDIRPQMRSPSDDLPQYVYALAFHVITFWFMNLKLDDRPLYTAWIARNLTYTDKTGKEVIEDQGLVTMDMMDRVAYSDRDETAADPHFAKQTDGEVSQRTWIVGLSLLTIETAGRTGLSQLTRRRPSCTKYFTYRPSLRSPPRHQVPLTTGLAADAFYTSSYIGVLPEDVLQEFYSSFSLVSPKSERPVPLPEEDAVNRAISSFDRNSTVDGHKIGVIYMGPGQESEAEILANTCGSADYTSFVSELGILTRLREAAFNTQGLDRTTDSDGQYTYCWRDRATEIVFHITTMMPTDNEDDPNCIKKKSHIGNDFVNIVWNDSGEPFQFDTFPSAFNYVYIVITPETTHSFTSLRDRKIPPPCFYKVHVLSAPGFPEISPAAETKVVSAKALPHFVRLVALNASVFSLVWANREGGEHVSPWRNRLREIKRLRDKYASTKSLAGVGSSTNSPSPLSLGPHGSAPPPSTEKSTNSLPTLSSLPTNRDRGVSNLANRSSLATFASESRSSLTPSSADTDHNE